jgi:hypothetical protein
MAQKENNRVTKVFDKIREGVGKRDYTDCFCSEREKY